MTEENGTNILQLLSETTQDDLEKQIGTPKLNYDLVFGEFIEAKKEAELLGEIYREAEEKLQALPEYAAVEKAIEKLEYANALVRDWEQAVKRCGMADWVSLGRKRDGKQYPGGYVQIREEIVVANTESVYGYLLFHDPDLLKISHKAKELNAKVKSGELKHADILIQKTSIFTVKKDLAEFMTNEDEKENS